MREPEAVDIVDGRFDLAIRVGALADSSTLITRRLATVGAALYAAPSYLETKRAFGGVRIRPTRNLRQSKARDGSWLCRLRRRREGTQEQRCRR